ncbi:MAG: hypothetical protein IKG55_05390 [Solobacterium sp.]|nr:hypothetical protein [Solobacterium sp.]
MLINGYLILPQGLIVIWLAFILLYRSFYNRRVNRILSGHKASPISAPWKMAVITLIGSLIVYNLIMLSQMKNTRRNMVYDSSQFFAMSYSANSWAELDHRAYNGMYSHEENDLYTKAEYAQGDFAYTVFTSTIPHDGMHPDMLICIEYTGEPKDFYTMFSTCRFLDPEGNIIHTSMKGDLPDSHFMYMVRYQAECTVEITLDYIADEDDARLINDTDLEKKYELLEKVSQVHECFSLDVKQPY